MHEPPHAEIYQTPVGTSTWRIDSAWQLFPATRCLGWLRSSLEQLAAAPKCRKGRREERKEKTEITLQGTRASLLSLPSSLFAPALQTKVCQEDWPHTIDTAD
jgi:hypothetical protein